MADDHDDIPDRFAPLDEVPVPGWRHRTMQKLDDGTVVELAEPVADRRRWPMAVAAAAVVAVLGAGMLAWPRDDGGEARVAAGAHPGFGDLPVVDQPLLCPPVLLDLSALDVQPAPVTGTVEPGVPAPYDLTWQQDGYEVVVSYPGPFVRTLDLPPNEQVTLAEGRVAHLEYRTAVTADVGTERGEVNQCGSNFWLSVRPVPAPTGPMSPSDPARAELLDLAEAIHIRPPEGLVAVPDVVGLDVISAQDALARAGVIPAGDAPVYRPLDARPVASQTPAPGTVVPIGDPVSITLEAEVTTTTAPPPPIDVQLPIPDEPLECPMGRLSIAGGVYSEPSVAFADTLEWDNGGGYTVQLSWPPSSYGHTGARDLEVAGRPALMLDGGDGQNLLFDTGLPSGPCQYLEIGVYGGPSIEERETRAVTLAEHSITFQAPGDGEPPSVVGLPLAQAVDALARAGFIADWDARPGLGDESPHPSADPVTSQLTEPQGVVRLTT